MKITIDELLKAGVHFGHKTERWNPKMKPFIFSARNGIYIIDLIKTTDQLKKAHKYVMDTVANGGEVLFVGTKKQAKEMVKQEALASDSFYVSERWLGGLLTNFNTVKRTIDRLKQYEKKIADGGFSNLTKKEITAKEREIEKLEKIFGGIKQMTKTPDLIFIVDTKKHKIAIHEASLMGIPVIAIVDTNSDPDMIEIPIPGNDDAIKSIEVITRVISDAVNTGRMLRKESEKIAAEAAAAQKAARKAEGGGSEEVEVADEEETSKQEKIRKKPRRAE